MNCRDTTTRDLNCPGARANKETGPRTDADISTELICCYINEVKVDDVCGGKPFPSFQERSKLSNKMDDHVNNNQDGFQELYFEAHEELGEIVSEANSEVDAEDIQEEHTLLDEMETLCDADPGSVDIWR